MAETGPVEVVDEAARIQKLEDELRQCREALAIAEAKNMTLIWDVLAKKSMCTRVTNLPRVKQIGQSVGDCSIGSRLPSNMPKVQLFRGECKRKPGDEKSAGQPETRIVTSFALRDYLEVNDVTRLHKLIAILPLLNKHRHIPTFLGGFRTDSHIYLMSSATLGAAEQMDAGRLGSATPDQRKSWCGQLAATVSFCHSVRVYCKLIRPEMLYARPMSDGSEDLVIIDTSSFCKSLPGNMLPKEAPVDGEDTAPYPPESLVSRYDPYSADIFSLGVVICYILSCGRIGAKQVKDTIGNSVDGAKELAKAVAKFLPAGEDVDGLEYLFGQLLSHIPKERPKAEEICKKIPWIKPYFPSTKDQRDGAVEAAMQKLTAGLGALKAMGKFKRLLGGGKNRLRRSQSICIVKSDTSERNEAKETKSPKQGPAGSPPGSPIDGPVSPKGAFPYRAKGLKGSKLVSNPPPESDPVFLKNGRRQSGTSRSQNLRVQVPGKTATKLAAAVGQESSELLARRRRSLERAKKHKSSPFRRGSNAKNSKEMSNLKDKTLSKLRKQLSKLGIDGDVSLHRILPPTSPVAVRSEPNSPLLGSSSMLPAVSNSKAKDTVAPLLQPIQVKPSAAGSTGSKVKKTFTPSSWIVKEGDEGGSKDLHERIDTSFLC